MIKKRTHRFGDFKDLNESIIEPRFEEFEDEISIDDLGTDEKEKDTSEEDIKLDDLDFGDKEEETEIQSEEKSDDNENISPHKKKMDFIVSILNDYKKYIDKSGDINDSIKAKIEKIFDILS